MSAPADDPPVLNSPLKPLVPALVGQSLKRYFGSCWGPLVPYLAAYLLYAGLKLPVNPAADSNAPTLLHIYWGLHICHLSLGLVALLSWYRPGSDGHSDLALLRSITFQGLPWVCLALLLWLPGIYLEWPSDPWEHLRRINEWRTHDFVVEHTTWRKFSYFLAYSLTGHLTAWSQLRYLSGYYVAVCLLFYIQYYRLARSVGLSESVSFIAVLVSLMTFGNSVFSFHRYYGLSSSILAQIGAVALTCLALDVARTWTPRPNGSPRRPRAGFLFSRAATAGALAGLIAFSHPQGLSIAALGIAAVAGWRCANHLRLAGLALLTGLVLFGSYLFVQFYPKPAIIADYRHAGWLNAWYGFNFLDTSSPAWPGMMQVLGVFGLLNVFLSWPLVRSNHVVAWLTLSPFVALQLPLFSIPLAQIIANHGGETSIATFHRMFLAVPSGLAAIVALPKFVDWWRARSIPAQAGSNSERGSGAHPPRVSPQLLPSARRATLGVPFFLLLVGLAASLTIPIAYPGYGRLWQVLARTPADQEMHPAWEAFAAQQTGLLRKDSDLPVLTASSTGFALSLQGVGHLTGLSRLYAAGSWTPTGDVIIGLRFLSGPERIRPRLVLLLEPSAFVTSQSVAGFASMHWFGSEAVLSTAGLPELRKAAAAAGFAPLQAQTCAPSFQFFKP